MSNVLQMQPGAITDLERYARAIGGGLPVDGRFITEDGRVLHFLGISSPEGTCARGRDVPVAVFGYDAPQDGRGGREQLPQCAFAVLVRDPTVGEKEQWRRRTGNHTTCLEGVELLELVEMRGPLAVFRLTGRLQIYVNLV